MKVFLIGYMGSGKSTLGKRLAAALNLSFTDLDKHIENSTGRSIDNWFEEGEEAFRLVEQQALHDLLRLHDKVIACGGGTPCYFDNLDQMKEAGLVIYLRLDPKTIQHRLEQSKENRPLIKGLTGDKLFNYIQSTLEERKAFYQQAHLIWDALDVRSASLDLLVQEIKVYHSR